MKDLTITSTIKVYEFDELTKTDQALMTAAMEATGRSEPLLSFGSCFLHR